MEIDERRLAERRGLIDHCNYFFLPPGSFYSALEEAIELAAAGRKEQKVTLEGCLVPAAELIRDYHLEDFVEAKAQDAGGEEAPLRGFEPRFPD